MKYTDVKNLRVSDKKNKPGKSKLIPVIGLAFLITTVLMYFRKDIKKAFNPITFVGKVSAAELHVTDGRTNVLVLGSDKRKEGSSTGNPTLTDTILVASIGSIEKDVVLISIPRDLWVRWKTDKGDYTYSKINAVYDYTSYQGEKIGGIDNLTSVVNEILGIPVHYYGVVTFDLFKEAINIMGGIEINVDNSFTDYNYPVEGKEAAPVISDRYETVHFEKGLQQMDGDTALKFARSRKGDNNEGTDFARSKRQQKVIMAIKDKALTAETLLNPVKIKDLYDSYSKNVDTNVDFSTVQSFYLLSQQIEFNKVISVVLDDRSEAIDGGLLYSPEDTNPYGGQYVLLPKTGNYEQIHAYAKRYLFGER